jgi:hypothetical protein
MEVEQSVGTTSVLSETKELAFGEIQIVGYLTAEVYDSK